MDPTIILSLVGQSFSIYSELRAQAKAGGITDEQLDAVEADYRRRIDRRDNEDGTDG